MKQLLIVMKMKAKLEKRKIESHWVRILNWHKMSKYVKCMVKIKGSYRVAVKGVWLPRGSDECLVNEGVIYRDNSIDDIIPLQG